jgi:hypothetical protein
MVTSFAVTLSGASSTRLARWARDDTAAANATQAPRISVMIACMT